MTFWYHSPAARGWICPPPPGDAAAFHRSLPGYAPTALIAVADVAAELAVGRVFVKDESTRLGLPAFKILGASWACHRVLEHHPGATLVAATDGNHGRAVARMAAYFGVDAKIFVPRVMLPATAERIAAEGAEIAWVDGDYDAAVRYAAEFAEQPGRALVQDTAWDGYQQVPAWIVAGRARHGRLRTDEPDQRPAHRGAHGGDGDGRVELRHDLQFGMAGAAGRLRRGGQRQRSTGAARGRRPPPVPCLRGPQRRCHPGRRPRRPRCPRAPRGTRT